MNEELETLQIVVRRLEEAGIAYMVTGSMAVSIYGLPRMTRDIDIVLEVGFGDVERVCKLFEADFYVDPEAVLVAITRHGMFNIIHNTFIVKVDFIIRKDEAYRHEEFKRRKNGTIEGIAVSVVSPEDLILSKLVWAKESRSEMHIRDVRSIIENTQFLDYDYLRHWANRLDVMEFYRELANE